MSLQFDVNDCAVFEHGTINIYKCTNGDHIILKDGTDSFRIKIMSDKKSAKQEISILNQIFYSDGKREDAWTNDNIVKYYKLTDEQKDALKANFEKLYTGSLKPIPDVLLLELCTMSVLEFKTNLNNTTFVDSLNISLFDSVADKQEKVKLNFRNQVFNGLDYLFYRHIIHFDIKPENIFVSLDDDNTPTYKIGNFKHAQHYDYATFNIDIKHFTKGYAPVIVKEKSNLYSKLFFTTYARDLYAFFVTVDNLFNLDPPTEFNPTEGYPGMNYLIDNIISKNDLGTGYIPKNDPSAISVYIKLYRRIKADFKADEHETPKKGSIRKSITRLLSRKSTKISKSQTKKQRNTLINNRDYKNNVSNMFNIHNQRRSDLFNRMTSHFSRLNQKVTI